MATVRWVALVIVVVIVSVSAVVMCRPDSESAAMKSSNIHEFSVRMPYWGNNPIRKLNDLFGNVKGGQTMVLRFKVSNVGPLTGIGVDDIHVEEGKLVFYSEEGEYEFLPGPDKTTVVNVKFNNRPVQKMLHFRDGCPYLMLWFSYNYGREEVVTAGLTLEGVIREDLSKDFDYLQYVACRGPTSNRATVELKVQFSDDYVGHIGRCYAWRTQ